MRKQTTVNELATATKSASAAHNTCSPFLLLETRLLLRLKQTLMKNKFLVLLCVISLIGCKESKQKVPKLSDKFELTSDQPVDSVLRQELEQIAVKDQTLRLLLPNVAERFGKGSDEENYIWTLIHREDSICLYKTIRILEEYGWLGKSRVGVKANQSLWLVIQHADIAIQESYLPLLRESVEMGESEGWHLAFLEDRILMRRNKKQVYGTQTIWDKEIGQLRVYPIQDVENVNIRREQIGLEPIEDYAKANGYFFDQKKQ